MKELLRCGGLGDLILHSDNDVRLQRNHSLLDLALKTCLLIG